MGISNFDDLRSWFFANVRGKGEGQEEAAPHWRLYLGDFGSREITPAANTRIADMDKSYQLLENSIRAQSELSNPRFRIITFAPGKHNNPTSETYFQLKSLAPAPAHTAGIAGLPAGVGSIQQYMDERLETERLRWKIQQLEEQVNAPSEKWERVLEYISGVPGIDKVLQTVALGLVSKLNPSAMPAIQAAMNGAPGQQTQTGEHEADDESDPNAVFLSNIHEASETLGTDPVTMAKRLNNLIKTNPDLARQLLQQ